MTEASKEVLDVLKRVRVRLAKPEAWTREQYARNTIGNAIGPREENATCWCLEGAIIREEPNYSQRYSAMQRLMAFVHPDMQPMLRRIARINDDPTTKHEHILKWLDTVIAYDSKLLGVPRD